MTEDQKQTLEDVGGELMLLETLLDAIEEGHLRDQTAADVARAADLAMVAKRVLDDAMAKLNGVVAPRPRAAGGSAE
ncbi:MAG: hypothetical protein ACOCY0_03295 [Roseicyclus sp.]